MSQDQTQGRVAVITGASSGIGASTARSLHSAGYRVVLLARRADLIESLADELGEGAIAIAADVTDRDTLVAAAERVKQEFGGADVLVNNAGVMLVGPFSSDLREDYRKMIEINLLGAITATEVFLDQLKDGGGDLVNISSVAGRISSPVSCVYSASKWGLGGWSEGMRQELRGQVRVTLVEPGIVDTDLASHITHDATREHVEHVYEAATVTSMDIAEVITFSLQRPRHLAINEILLRPADQLA